jgi:hypothetical protein
MSEIRRYKTIAKAVTTLEGGVIAVKDVVVEPCDKGYLVMHTDHLTAINQAKIEAVREFVDALIEDTDGRDSARLSVNHILNRCREHIEQLKE